MCRTSTSTSNAALSTTSKSGRLQERLQPCLSRAHAGFSDDALPRDRALGLLVLRPAQWRGPGAMVRGVSNGEQGGRAARRPARPLLFSLVKAQQRILFPHVTTPELPPELLGFSPALLGKTSFSIQIPALHGIGQGPPARPQRSHLGGRSLTYGLHRTNFVALRVTQWATLTRRFGCPKSWTIFVREENYIRTLFSAKK